MRITRVGHQQVATEHTDLRPNPFFLPDGELEHPFVVDIIHVVVDRAKGAGRFAGAQVVGLFVVGRSAEVGTGMGRGVVYLVTEAETAVLEGVVEP